MNQGLLGYPRNRKPAPEDLALIVLSEEAEIAINNIESNGGALSNKEKYFVAKWVDRIHTKGDWATRGFLAYAGFGDDLCKLTDWKNGVLMTNAGATFDGQNWVFDGASFINANFNPTTEGIAIYDSLFGVYIEKNDATGVEIIMGADGTAWELRADLTSYRMNQEQANPSIQEEFRSKGLYVATQIALSDRPFYKNGELIVNDTLARPEVFPDDNVSLGSRNFGSYAWNGQLSLFFAGAAIGFDQADFYAGFEDFRTSLHPEILYNLPQPNQAFSYRPGDEADIEASQMLHFRKAMAHWNGTAPKLVNFTTLHADTPNAFGGIERITDSVGGQLFGSGLYQSEFITSVDSWAGTNGGLTFNQAVGGRTELLKFTSAVSASGYKSFNSSANSQMDTIDNTTVKRVKISLYLPSTGVIDGYDVALYDGVVQSVAQDLAATQDGWIDIDVTGSWVVGSNVLLVVYPKSGGVGNWLSTAADTIYVKDAYVENTVYNGSLLNYRIDHYTSIGWYGTPMDDAVIWDTRIDNALASLLLGLDGWFLSSQGQLFSIFNFETGSRNRLNYAPFNLTGKYFISSTTDDSAPTYCLYNNLGSNRIAYVWIKTAANVNEVSLFCRKHY